MKLLVTGDRNWKDRETLWKILDGYKKDFGIHLTIIHGDCRGADIMADKWARKNGIDRIIFPANWEGRYKTAGPIRNRKMFDISKPDIVLAFHKNIHQSKGTKDMINYARSHGCTIIHIEI